DEKSVTLYDGMILKLHYQVTIVIMTIGFLAVSQHWYAEQDMICKKLSNVESKIPLNEEHLNICRSYPYVEEGEGEEVHRRYILYYRWIPWAFLLLTTMYYIPRIASKTFTRTITKQMKSMLVNARNESFGDPESVEFKKAVQYIRENKGSHNGIYWTYIGLNCLALGVDVFTMFLWDILLQGRFSRYGLSLPEWYKRNPKDFSDEISRTFPPFVKCKIESVHLIASADAKAYGCHMTYMQLYEKVFILLWFWLVIMIIITTVYIIYIMLFGPYVIVKGCLTRGRGVQGVTTVGDYYIKFRLKAHVSEAKCKHLFEADLDKYPLK
ncbi:unnamed protein product, partial [Meganyctiphanes norvegica]